MSTEQSDAQADAIARGDIVPEVAAEVEAEAAAAEQAAADEQAAVDAKAIEDDAAAAEAAKPAEEAAAKEEPPAEEDAHGNMIPQTRFNQAVGKERSRAETAEAELQQYRQREAQQVQAQDFEASKAKQAEMLKQHSSLLADGDLEKAAEVMGDVLQLRDDMQNARMDRQANNARNSAKVEVQYDATVERLETKYPQINPDSEDFDQAAVRRVQMMVTGIMQAEGKSPAEALTEATDILLKPKEKESLREKPSKEVVESGLRRTADQIDKNLKAAKAQPPATTEVGADHDATGGVLSAQSIGDMSWDEFIKVPDSELAKLRGDFIN